MRNGTTMQRPIKSPSWITESGLRWALGAMIWVVSVGLVVVAIMVAPDSTRTNNRLCLEQVANDEHTSLEAFFQNPTQQNALVQAATRCSH